MAFSLYLSSYKDPGHVGLGTHPYAVWPQPQLNDHVCSDPIFKAGLVLRYQGVSSLEPQHVFLGDTIHPIPTRPGLELLELPPVLLDRRIEGEGRDEAPHVTALASLADQPCARIWQEATYNVWGEGNPLQVPGLLHDAAFSFNMSWNSTNSHSCVTRKCLQSYDTGNVRAISHLLRLR